MDCRGAAHALTQIATLLELHGADRARVRDMQTAARSVASGGACEIDEATRRNLIDRSTLSTDACEVLDDLAETNGSALLERLQEETPEGLMEMLRVPGLGPARIRQIHDGLQIDTLQQLEQSARDGRLAALPRFGTRTADKILKGISDLRATGAYVLWQHGRAAVSYTHLTLPTNREV